MHCVSCSLRFAQESYSHTPTTLVTAPSLSNQTSYVCIYFSIPIHIDLFMCISFPSIQILSYSCTYIYCQDSYESISNINLFICISSHFTYLYFRIHVVHVCKHTCIFIHIYLPHHSMHLCFPTHMHRYFDTDVHTSAFSYASVLPIHIHLSAYFYASIFQLSCVYTCLFIDSLPHLYTMIFSYPCVSIWNRYVSIFPINAHIPIFICIYFLVIYINPSPFIHKWVWKFIRTQFPVRVSKNLQQGSACGEGTGYRGDNTGQKKSRGTAQPPSRVILRKSVLGQATGWCRNQWGSADRIYVRI